MIKEQDSSDSSFQRCILSDGVPVFRKGRIVGSLEVASCKDMATADNGNNLCLRGDWDPEDRSFCNFYPILKLDAIPTLTREE